MADLSQYLEQNPLAAHEMGRIPRFKDVFSAQAEQSITNLKARAERYPDKKDLLWLEYTAQAEPVHCRLKYGMRLQSTLTRTPILEQYFQDTSKERLSLLFDTDSGQLAFLSYFWEGDDIPPTLGPLKVFAEEHVYPIAEPGGKGITIDITKDNPEFAFGKFSLPHEIFTSLIVPKSDILTTFDGRKHLYAYNPQKHYFIQEREKGLEALLHRHSSLSLPTTDVAQTTESLFKSIPLLPSSTP